MARGKNAIDPRPCPHSPNRQREFCLLCKAASKFEKVPEADRTHHNGICGKPGPTVSTIGLSTCPDCILGYKIT